MIHHLSEDIADIMEMLTEFDTGRWRTLATNLRLNPSSMITIENNHNNVLRCLQLALMEWYYNYEKPSWKKLAKAMKPLDGNIFERIVSGNIIMEKCYKISYSHEMKDVQCSVELYQEHIRRRSV